MSNAFQMRKTSIQTGQSAVVAHALHVLAVSNDNIEREAAVARRNRDRHEARRFKQAQHLN